MKTTHSTRPTPRDLLRLATQAAFAVVLLTPVRHYIGPQQKVDAAKNDQDAFPLSTYPMFSADRRGRITVPHVVGRTATGERIIAHHWHFGRGGLNQVRRQISKALREGRAVDVAQKYADSLAAQAECELAADRTWAAIQTRENQIVEVFAVRARFRFDDYFGGRTHPQAESIHARCPVGGTAVAGPAKALPRYAS